MVKLGCFFLAGLFSFTVWGQEQSVLEVLEVENHAIGRATLVKDNGDGTGLALTAFHVVEGLKNNPDGFRIRYRDGKVGKGATVVTFDPERDVAILRVWVAPGAVATPIDTAQPDQVWLLDKQWNRHELKLSIRQKACDYYDYAPQPGESGGGIFADGKLVGVVSGGWFWMDRETPEQPLKTWPLRAGRPFMVEGVR